jgi:hypothetical protein
VPNAEVAVSSQSANAALISALIADPLVKVDVLENQKFLTEQTAWFEALPEAQKQARVKALEAAVEKGELLSDPSHTAQQRQAYQTAETARLAQIQQRYPQLGQLKADEAGEVWGGVYQSVANRETATNCGVGYYACSRTLMITTAGNELSLGIEACNAGFLACSYMD